MYQTTQASVQFLKGNMRALVGGLVMVGLLLVSFMLYRSWADRSPISPYRPEDRPALTKIMQADWYWLVADGATDYSMDYMFDHKAATLRYPDNSLSIDVYREKGQPVAFITYHRLDNCKGRIQFLAVSRDARSRGYGKKLMLHALRKLAQQGFYTVELATRIVNQPARKLYRKLGFVETWVDDGFVGFSKNLYATDGAGDGAFLVPDIC